MTLLAASAPDDVTLAQTLNDFEAFAAENFFALDVSGVCSIGYAPEGLLRFLEARLGDEALATWSAENATDLDVRPGRSLGHFGNVRLAGRIERGEVAVWDDRCQGQGGTMLRRDNKLVLFFKEEDIFCFTSPTRVTQRPQHLKFNKRTQ